MSERASDARLLCPRLLFVGGFWVGVKASKEADGRSCFLVRSSTENSKRKHSFLSFILRRRRNATPPAPTPTQTHPGPHHGGTRLHPLRRPPARALPRPHPRRRWRRVWHGGRRRRHLARVERGQELAGWREAAGWAAGEEERRVAGGAVLATLACCARGRVCFASPPPTPPLVPLCEGEMVQCVRAACGLLCGRGAGVCWAAARVCAATRVGAAVAFWSAPPTPPPLACLLCSA